MEKHQAKGSKKKRWRASLGSIIRALKQFPFLDEGIAYGISLENLARNGKQKLTAADHIALSRMLIFTYIWKDRFDKKLNDALLDSVVYRPDEKRMPSKNRAAAAQRSMHEVIQALNAFLLTSSNFEHDGMPLRLFVLQRAAQLSEQETALFLTLVSFLNSGIRLSDSFHMEMSLGGLSKLLDMDMSVLLRLLCENGTMMKNGLVGIQDQEMNAANLPYSRVSIPSEVLKYVLYAPLNAAESAKLNNAPFFRNMKNDKYGINPSTEEIETWQQNAFAALEQAANEPAADQGGGDGVASEKCSPPFQNPPPAPVSVNSIKSFLASPEFAGKLHEIISWEKSKSILFCDYGFQDQRGLGSILLFYGPPGTGKTFAAEIIANELKRPLTMVSSVDILSRWVGEPGQNIKKTFQQAEEDGAVLLFDEADALFANRTGVNDATDRYANSDVNLLLQSLERFSGMAILTTNLDDNLDKALFRRFRFIVEFKIPDPEVRERMWRELIPSKMPLSPEIDFKRLASTFQLTAGNIRNAIFRAASRMISRGSSNGGLTEADLCEAAKEERICKQKKSISFHLDEN